VPFEVEMLKAIQTISCPFLDWLFEAVTIFGEQLFLIPIITLVFWSFDKETGYWLCWSLVSGNLLCNGIKGIVKAPRPIGVEGIRSLRVETATGYSFPSGHSHSIANFMTAAAIRVRRRWFTVLAVVVPLVVGFSRLYLGVHWPKDVLGGLVIGFLLPLGLWKLFRRFPFDRPMLYLISAAVFLPLLFFVDMADFWKSFGLSLGFVAGSFIEEYAVGFTVDGPLWRRLLRWAVGFAVLGGLYYVMKTFFPENNFFYLLRYFIIAFYAVALWPICFKKLRL